MKILIINYYWEPMVDAHAYRWPQLADELAEQGHSIEIITSKIRSIDNSLIKHRVSIKRIGILPSKNHPNLVLHDNSKKKISSKFSLKLLFIKMYSKLYWPDPLWHWLPGLVVELFKRRNVKYDYVISYYPCFSAHLGALIFKNVFGKRWCKWIADYGDAFSTSYEWPPNNYSIYSGINKWIEGLVYTHCDKFSVVNSETKKRYVEKFGESQKLIIVPHLAPKINSLAIPSGKNVVVLRYIGSFHAQVRNHELLFDLARILASSTNKKYKIEIYGPTEYWQGIDIPENINILGKVSRELALSLLSSADILLNVNNTTALMTPSKIIEYIATRRPIINIGREGLCEYRPLDRYTEHGMCMNFYGSNAGGSLESIELFIEQSSTKSQLTDGEIYECLAGHTSTDILRGYGMI